MKKQTRTFCDLIRQRSKENKLAVKAICHCSGVVSPLMALLRQELDSMVRVIYLLSIQDIGERERLIQLTLDGDKWSIATKNGRYRSIKDCEMVKKAQLLQGWTKSVYKFGCAFIHLSDFHNYTVEDPFRKLPTEERADILQHMRFYHGGPLNDTPDIREISFYIPQIFEKITSNLECYLEQLEKGDIIDVKNV